MASLTDIPQQLLSKDQKVQFISWLRGTPTTEQTRRTFCYLWRKQTGGNLDVTDYVAALSGAIPAPSIHARQIPPSTT